MTRPPSHHLPAVLHPLHHHVSHKPVSPLGKRLDVPSSLALVAQRLAQLRDVPRQPDLLHARVRPHRAHQLGLFHHRSMPLQQHAQRLRHFGGQRHHLALAEQQPLLPVVAEWAETGCALVSRIDVRRIHVSRIHCRCNFCIANRTRFFACNILPPALASKMISVDRCPSRFLGKPCAGPADRNGAV